MFLLFMSPLAPVFLAFALLWILDFHVAFFFFLVCIISTLSTLFFTLFFYVLGLVALFFMLFSLYSLLQFTWGLGNS